VDLPDAGTLSRERCTSTINLVGLVCIQVSSRLGDDAYPATPTRKRSPSGRLQSVASVSSTGIGVGVWRVGGDSRLISGDYHSGDLIDMPFHVAKSD
jgi:hypothetical protein